MADYKAIHGKNIQHLASDLDNAEGEGQIWFNTTTSDYKTIVKIAGAWATGNEINNAGQNMQGAGTQTAGVIAGRGPAISTLVEEYDGLSWTAAPAMNTGATNATVVGIKTAALKAGGYFGSNPYVLGETEIYDGSSWTEVNDLGTDRYGHYAGGTTTAAIIAGGRSQAPVPAPTNVAISEEWDGTNWAEGNDMNNARNSGAYANQATQTAALIYGGGPGGDANVESYNGTSWTEENNLNVAQQADSGAGIQTFALEFGGANPGASAVGTTEIWDGTSWTEIADMSAVRGDSAGFGFADSAVCAGGNQDPKAQTEEWDFTATLVAGAWASGGALNTTRYANTAWGTVPAGLTTGGLPGNIVNSEEYDGTSWTEGDNLNTGRSWVGGSMGTQTAAVLAGGTVPPPVLANVEEYNGTSWSEETDIPTAVGRTASLGTLTAGLAFGGRVASAPPPANAVVETYEYDGTSWADGGDLGTASYNMFSFGTQTAGIGAGGYDGSPAHSEAWDYNGTAWTDASADIGTARYQGGSAGTVNTSGLIFGGGNGTANLANVEEYDGTTWAESADLPAARGAPGGAGTGAAAFVTGGVAPGTVNTTFEWARTQNIKVIDD